MNVHLICRNFKDDRVLPRFARHLVKHNGWMIGATPNPAADINYWFAYFEWQKHKGFDKSKRMAAYMTHLEEVDKPENAKVKLYHAVARGVGLRVAMNQTQRAALEKAYGPSVCPPLPLELDHFRLRSERAMKKPVIGVSGYVYKSGRKGEELLTWLLQSKLAQKCDWRASGRGWPVPTKMYPWADLPAFYQSLDIFVCTSRVEGGPMTTLEAMSCGVPVVIPRDVGVHNELPDAPGVFKYARGDPKGLAARLEEAIEYVLGGQVDREGLRRATAPHSVKAFCKQHQVIFEDFMYNKPPVGVLPDWQGNCGIYLVAFGKPARDSAKILMAGLKKHMPHVPVALCSDKPIGLEDRLIKRGDSDIGGRGAKLLAYKLAPQEWQYVFYIDVDTECHADLNFYFELLQTGWEFVICKEPHLHDLARNYQRRQGTEDYVRTINALGTDEALMINGGVWAFRRCPRVEAFFDRWYREWDEHGAARDQGPWVRAMYADPLRLLVLSNQWNTFPRYMAKEKTAGLLHFPGRARRWTGAVPGRLDAPEAWQMVDETKKRK